MLCEISQLVDRLTNREPFQVLSPEWTLDSTGESGSSDRADKPRVVAPTGPVFLIRVHRFRVVGINTLFIMKRC